MFNIFKQLSLRTNLSCSIIDRTIHTAPCLLAARRGKRIARNRANQLKAKQRKAENKDAKKIYIPYNIRMQKGLISAKKRYSDIGKLELPKDDTFFTEGFKEITYSFEEAIDLHREVLEPSLLNDPNALVFAKIELNLRLKRKTKFLNNLEGIYLYSNEYPFKKTTKVVAICSSDEEAEECKNLGASLSGGKDVIKIIKDKELKEVDYDYIVCHNDMLIHLAECKKILGDNFPSSSLNNFGTDMKKLVYKFLNGVRYKTQGDVLEKDYAALNLHFGRLDMTKEQLKQNLIGLLKEINKHKPAEAPHPFITRVQIQVPPNDECFKIDFWNYLNLEDPYIYELEQFEKEKEEDKKKPKKKK